MFTLHCYFALAKKGGRSFKESVELMLNRRLSDPISLAFAIDGQKIFPISMQENAVNDTETNVYRAIYAYVMVNSKNTDHADGNVKISYHKLGDESRSKARDILHPLFKLLDWDELFRIIFLLDIALTASSRGIRKIIYSALEPFYDDYPGVSAVRSANAGFIYKLIEDSFTENQSNQAKSEYIRFDVLRNSTDIYKNISVLQMFSGLESRLYFSYSSSGKMKSSVDLIYKLFSGEPLPIDESFYDRVSSLLEDSLQESFDQLNYPKEKRVAFIDGLASSILSLSRENDDREFTYRGRSIQKSSLSIPASPPLTWKSDRQEGETAPEFIMRAYAQWHGHGLTLLHVRKLDEPLVQALYYHMRKHLPLPDGFDLPTKPQQNDRDLVVLREKAEITVPDNADADHVFREIERLRQAEIRRKRREI